MGRELKITAEYYAPVKQKSSQMDSRTQNKDVVADELKLVVKSLITNAWFIMNVDCLEDQYRLSLRNEQRGIPSVPQSVADRVLLDQFQNEGTKNALTSHLGKFFDKNKPTDWQAIE